MNKSLEPTARGVYVPVVTPFSARGHVDIESFGKLVRSLAREEVGIVVSGTTGEGHKLTMSEKIKLIEIAILSKRVRQDLNLEVICATGTRKLSEAVNIATYAKTMKAAGILALPPIEYKTHEINRFYSEIAKRASGIPVYAYHIDLPNDFKSLLTPEIVGDLFRDGVIAGVKDSSGDIGLLPAWKAEAPGLTVMVGSDRLIRHAAGNGHADAAVSGLANIIAKNVVSAFMNQGETGARAQMHLDAVLDALEGGRGGEQKRDFVAALKFCMGELGMITENGTRAGAVLQSAEKKDLLECFQGRRAQIDEKLDSTRITSLFI